MLFKQTTSSESFKVWTWKDSENKLLLKFSILAMIISFIFMKIIYPYPNFMPPDSNSYLRAASTNQLINLWPIGYSKFVRLISCFTKSHFILVLIQYALLQASALYFLFSIRYLLSPGKWAFRTLLAVSVLNPLSIHIANFVSSDCLFTALSILWFTQLLWIIYEPTRKLLYAHAVITLLAFVVRFNALYYPIISIPVILFSSTTRWNKVMGIGLTVLLLGIFIGRTAYEYKLKTNTIQYSAVGGWQLAASALYGYAYAKPIPAEKVPAQFRALHTIVNKHMEWIRKIPPIFRPDNEVAVYYFWDFNSPLRLYMSKLYPKTTDDDFFYKWATFSPLYSSYGKYLITQYPGKFVQYYLWPNFVKYYAPPTKFMSSYNMKGETVEPEVVSWFGWKNNKLPSYFKDKEIQITLPFPILFAAINIIFVLGLFSFVFLGGYKDSSILCKHILWTTVAVWFINMAFSVMASPIELRYQLFPMVFTLVFGWLLIHYTIIQTKRESDRKFVTDNSIPTTAF